ncbi:TPA: hypothetical protein N0F65_000126, partial [Lagenidium giganteum]
NNARQSPAFKMITSLTVPQIMIVSPVLLLVSTFTLFNFQNLFRAIASCKASSFKFTFQHVLLMAILLALIAIFNALDKNNKLQEQQLRLLQEQKDKSKRD